MPDWIGDHPSFIRVESQEHSIGDMLGLLEKGYCSDHLLERILDTYEGRLVRHLSHLLHLQKRPFGNDQKRGVAKAALNANSSSYSIILVLTLYTSVRVII